MTRIGFYTHGRQAEPAGARAALCERCGVPLRFETDGDGRVLEYCDACRTVKVLSQVA